MSPIVPFSPPDIDEDAIDAVVAVLRSGWITTGPVAAELEEELAQYCGTERAVALNSCTAALELALRVLEVGPGDEVIVPAYTYTASAAVVDHVGATIVLVDGAPGTGVPDVETYLRAVTPRTKAIIPVDLGGVAFPSRELATALDGVPFTPQGPLQEGLGRPAVIADAAHSLGATLDEARTGNIGDFTAFSFHAVKNLTTAEGGALTWRPDLDVDHTELERRVRRLALHGQDRDALTKLTTAAWDYDIVELGYKMNMPDTLAALGLSQLRRYEQSISRRHELLSIYRDADLPVTFLEHEGPGFRSSAHLAITRIPDHLVDHRDQVIGSMRAAGVASNVHFKPLPLLTAYRDKGFDIADYPHAHDYFRGEITLPLFGTMSDAQVTTVAKRYAEALASVG